jgi:hypothetical protein
LDWSGLSKVPDEFSSEFFRTVFFRNMWSFSYFTVCFFFFNKS